MVKLIEDLGLKKVGDRNRRFGLFLCDCGKIFESRIGNANKSCGCSKSKVRKEIEIGKKYNMLTILYDCGIINKERIVVAECECGNIKLHYYNAIKKGYTKSCGCKPYVTKYGDSGESYTRIYNIYDHMKSRCYNKNCDSYRYYGGSGITICDEWKNDFMKFRDWAISNGYSEELTIDRIDVVGNYEPINCQWITRSENTIKSNTIDRKRKESIK